MRRIVSWTLLATLLVGCSDDTSTPGTADLALRDGISSGDAQKPGGEGPKPGDLGRREYLPPPPPGDGGAGECEGLGNKLRLSFVVKMLELTSTDVTLVKGAKGVIGFTGSTVDGAYSFWFGRDGDPAAAAFDTSKVYFVTAAPYHLRLELWPKGSGATCASSSKCDTYYAVNGVLKIVTTTAPTAGTFQVSSVVYQKDCWKDQPSGPPDVSKCSIVGGTLYGCFKVD
jgi:hypothetical protein